LPASGSAETGPGTRLTFAVAAALVAWLSVFGFMGLALRCFRGRHAAAHYLADASYWVYLIHMPLVCLLQLDLFTLRLSAELKCCVVLGVTVLLSLLSYHSMVRYTAIGTFLHGARSRRRSFG
jgi:glucans biosynthesis protein C